MWYSVLAKSLPETVAINGTKYRIRYGYRTMIAVEMIIYEDMSDEQKMEQSLSLFYKDIPDDTEEAVRKLLWFHRCGAEERSKETSKGRSKGQQYRAYDFQQDAGMIYAAFKQQYDINLHKTASEDLHWWEFSALLENLSDDTKMGKVMYWRTCDINGMSKAEQRYIKKMREIFALKENVMSIDDPMTRLERRNAEMTSYIRRRYEECQIK